MSMENWNVLAGVAKINMILLRMKSWILNSKRRNPERLYKFNAGVKIPVK